KPAEGPDRPPPAPRRRRPAPGRTHPRHRCREQGADRRAVRRPGRARQGHPPGLELAAGAPRDGRSHRGHASGPPRSRSAGGRVARAESLARGSGRMRSLLERAWQRAWLGPLAALVATWCLFAALAPSTFARAANAVTMARQTTVVAIAAVGMTLVIISGG